MFKVWTMYVCRYGQCIPPKPQKAKLRDLTCLELSHPFSHSLLVVRLGRSHSTVVVDAGMDGAPDVAPGVAPDVGQDLVAEGVGQDLVAEGFGQDLVAEGFGQDLVAEGVGQDLVAEGVGQDLVAEGFAVTSVLDMPSQHGDLASVAEGKHAAATCQSGQRNPTERQTMAAAPLPSKPSAYALGEQAMRRQDLKRGPPSASTLKGGSPCVPLGGRGSVAADVAGGSANGSFPLSKEDMRKANADRRRRQRNCGSQSMADPGAVGGQDAGDDGPFISVPKTIASVPGVQGNIPPLSSDASAAAGVTLAVAGVTLVVAGVTVLLQSSGVHPGPGPADTEQRPDGPTVDKVRK